MNWQHSVYAYPMVFAAVVAAILSGYALQSVRRRGRNPTVVSFAVLTAAVAFWTATTAVKLFLVAPGAKLLAYKLLHVGAMTAAPAFFVFALAYTDRRELLDRQVASALYVVPAVFLVVLFTNPLELGYTGWELSAVDGGVTLSVTDGPVSVFGLVYAFVLLFLGLGVIGQYALELDRPYRTQATLLIVGMVVPSVVAALELTDSPPLAGGVNLIPASLAVPAVTFGIAVYRYKLLDILSLAYAAAGAHSTDGLVVLDADEVVVHVNDHVRPLLGADDPLLGRPASEALPNYDDLAGDPPTCDALVAGERYVELTRIPLDRAGDPLGWVVSVRDVTPRKRYELALESRNDELEVLNRIVRHDIRNDMQLVTAYIDIVLDHEPLSDEARSQLETALRRALNTVDLTDVLGQLMRATNDDERRRALDVGDALREAVDDVREGYPNAAFTVDSLPPATVFANDLLDSVFVNVLKNAVVHSDRDRPSIAVSGAADDECVTVRIADDGPGIADDRKSVVFGKGAKGLGSPGTGTGLYLVDTIVSNFGGAVHIEDNEPRGSVFVIELPLATVEAAD
ncbi:histidine kinase N-terminal 7TM domain-containing protein [Haloferax volcanii]|uniref:histidine kinase n=3 Tax=Haloferax volcanii TaxID=2246 RepID=A0A384LHC5_HALVD|nr:histidine kinase N-terminal 7TM domain-containing protein [Haloferax volcanii]ADE03864.1 sensor box histidine kinase [Haloferax volcanii DS2]ELY28349.1 signal-transducing histidine kinase-like protein [Haloferax volcanii DS2]MBS8117852.1 PAS domain-containing protein [Haloferax volcanii]MBS8122864.1 PAS domain-containing protein [Haloferax volcanii]MBS8126732.1 PAS domain-containing protein [Haloferax volcanii]